VAIPAPTQAANGKRVLTGTVSAILIMAISLEVPLHCRTLARALCSAKRLAHRMSLGNHVACTALLPRLRAEPNVVPIPNNPRECREQAQLYAYLASTAEIPEDKEHFASLAESWINLAAEIEGALVLLSALDQIKFEDPHFDEAEYSEAA
jgi:hypothetical protein